MKQLPADPKNAPQQSTTIALPDLLRLLDTILETQQALKQSCEALRGLLDHFVYVESLAVFDEAKRAIERAERVLP